MASNVSPSTKPPCSPIDLPSPQPDAPRRNSMTHSAETVAFIGVASLAPSAASHLSLLHGTSCRGHGK
jgi:hypothetical protein